MDIKYLLTDSNEGSSILESAFTFAYVGDSVTEVYTVGRII